MKTNARMKRVREKIAPMRVQKQSVHLRSFSESKRGDTFDGDICEGVELLLEHLKNN